jgi:hypothetical protein
MKTSSGLYKKIVVIVIKIEISREWYSNVEKNIYIKQKNT